MSIYITYLIAGAPSNAASTHIGVGYTREESERTALYWANQQPWTRTRPFSRAPAWAREEAVRALTQVDAECQLCGAPMRVEARFSETCVCRACAHKD